MVVKLAEYPSIILKAKVLKGNFCCVWKLRGYINLILPRASLRWLVYCRNIGDGTPVERKEKKTKMNLNYNQRKLKGPSCMLSLFLSNWRWIFVNIVLNQQCLPGAERVLTRRVVTSLVHVHDWVHARDAEHHCPSPPLPHWANVFLVWVFIIQQANDISQGASSLLRFKIKV